MTLRRELVIIASINLAEWNYRAWLCEVGKPDPQDVHPEYGVILVDKTDASHILTSMFSGNGNWRQSSYHDYYLGLSYQGVTRLHNEIEKAADRDLRRKQDRFLRCECGDSKGKCFCIDEVA